MTHIRIFFLFFIAALSGCEFELDENIPIGNADLKITGIKPKRALRGDTLTIFGGGFNPIAYQNSVVFEVDRNTGENRIVDASPDSIKVIIPDNALTGDVKVYFGVDTVKSPEIFELISLLKRPTIQLISPEIAAPGTKVSIQMQTGLPESELPVVRFGENFVEVVREGNLVFSVRVPPLFPGPVNLQGGIVTPEGDTLLSKPFSFGVLPGISSAPLTIWTSRSSEYDVSKGQVTDVGFEVDVLYPQSDAGRVRQGISLENETGNIFWVSNLTSPVGQTRSILFRGNTNGSKPLKEFPLTRQFNDVVVSKNFLYLTGGIDNLNATGNHNIRRYTLNANGDIANVELLYQDPSKSAITNLKIVNDNFYWCDSLSKKIYKAVINNTTKKLENRTEIFAGSPLKNPIAIAIDELNGVFYVADRNGQLANNKTILWKGSLLTPGDPLINLYEQKTIHKINDLEIDISNKFLYWITTEGVYRKSFDKLIPGDKTRPTPVYGSVGGNYFDF